MTISSSMQRKGNPRKNGRFVVLRFPYCYKCFSKDNEEAFEHELSILTETQNIPGVCHVVKSGIAQDGETEYFCIQMNLYKTKWESIFIEGTEGDFCFRRVQEIAQSLLTPLAGLEELCIIHNDIAPSNIVIDLEGNFTLIDFGSAKHLSEAGRSEVQEGHAGYTAPEKWSSGITSIQSDIYSFGKIIDDLVQKGQSLNISYPVEFIRVVEKCTAIQPEDRYGSFKELAETIACISESKVESIASDIDASPRIVEIDSTPSKNNNGVQETKVPVQIYSPRSLSAIIKGIVLIIASSLLAGSIYMAVRPYSDSPEEQDALYHPSIVKDFKIIMSDINHNK